MKILGIIPARGGSKGVPRKNIRLLGEKPLLQYTAESALNAKKLDRVILSTEDEEIAEVGRRCGLDVPFMRPIELARDDTPSIDVVKHALEWIFLNDIEYDAVCLLQPTSPFRQSGLIDQCIEKFIEQKADTLVTVVKVPDKYNPHWVYFQNEDNTLKLSTGEAEPITRRQELPSAFSREGSIYITKSQVILDKSSLYGEKVICFEVDSSTCVNIDTILDWVNAEALLKGQ